MLTNTVQLFGTCCSSISHHYQPQAHCHIHSSSLSPSLLVFVQVLMHAAHPLVSILVLILTIYYPHYVCSNSNHHYCPSHTCCWLMYLIAYTADLYNLSYLSLTTISQVPSIHKLSHRSRSVTHSNSTTPWPLNLFQPFSLSYTRSHPCSSSLSCQVTPTISWLRFCTASRTITFPSLLPPFKHLPWHSTLPWVWTLTTRLCHAHSSASRSPPLYPLNVTHASISVLKSGSVWFFDLKMRQPDPNWS